VNNLKTLPWTQLLLAAIALLLFMNWWQMRSIKRELVYATYKLDEINDTTDLGLKNVESAVKDLSQ